MKWGGEKITAPGIYADIGMEYYHEWVEGKYRPLCDGPSVSSSALRTIFNDSPAHWWVKSPMNPQKVETPDTKPLILGRASHMLLCGQPHFAAEFIIRPDELAGKPWHGNRNDCKAWMDAAAKSGKTILTAEMVEHIKGMAISLGKHPLVQAGILRGLIERSIVFRDKETGVWIRCRPDAIPTDSGDYADIKTSAEIGEGTEKAMRNYRYDMQAALLRWACREVGLPFSSFADVFVESKPPHCVDIVTIDTRDLDEAESDCRTSLKVFAHCLKTEEWFGPVGTQRDARTAFFSEQFRERAKFRREFLQREIGEPA